MEILSEFYPKDPNCNSAAAVRLIAEWSLSFIFQTARKNIQLDDEDSANIGVGWDQPRPNTSLQIVVDICSEFLSRVTGCFAEIVGLIKEKVLKQGWWHRVKPLILLPRPSAVWPICRALFESIM